MAVPLSRRLRKASREIHDKSDALVNLKLGISASDPGVWAEGLAVFYEVFRFLEERLNYRKDSLLGDLIISPEMLRTKEFEKDLVLFYGPSYLEGQRQLNRPSVAAYLSHLRKLDEESPYLLIAYVYHMYMGLFSGGQILNAKAKLTMSSGSPGYSLSFPSSVKISDLKIRMRSAVDGMVDHIDVDTQDAIVKEGVKVFEYNNQVIASIQGVNEIFYKKVKNFLIYLFILIATLYLVLKVAF